MDKGVDPFPRHLEKLVDERQVGAGSGKQRRSDSKAVIARKRIFQVVLSAVHTILRHFWCVRFRISPVVWVEHIMPCIGEPVGTYPGVGFLLPLCLAGRAKANNNVSDLDPAGVDYVLIGNGSKNIAVYRHCP
jgi:hypothetical protein